MLESRAFLLFIFVSFTLLLTTYSGGIIMFLFQQLTKDTQMHCRRDSELAVKLAVLCGEPVVNQTKITVADI